MGVRREGIKKSLEILVIGGSLFLQVVGTDGTEYGQWDHYGVTQPSAYGVVMELMFSASFFCHALSVYNLFTILAGSATIVFDRSLLVVLSTFAFGTVIWILMLRCWTSLLVHQVCACCAVRPDNVKRSIFVADLVPTAFAILFVLVWLVAVRPHAASLSATTATRR